MIAASACLDHASMVASADSVVGFGGFAEKPMTNVRVGRFELCVAGAAAVSLQDMSAENVNATRTLLMRMSTSDSLLPAFTIHHMLRKDAGLPRAGVNPRMTASHFNSTSMLRASG